MGALTGSERIEALFREYYGAVLAYARRRAAASVADDVAAETFAVAWRKADAIPREPLPWLLGVARRVLADNRRSAARRLRLEHRLQTLGLPDDAPTVGGQIGEALAALSEPDREAILLVAWEGLSAKEAAVVVGLSATGFSVRLHRARRRLRVELERLFRQSANLHEVRPPLDQLPAIEVTKGDDR
jgi:RNA polymerase sigma-70 factor, ECF subfamily